MTSPKSLTLELERARHEFIMDLHLENLSLKEKIEKMEKELEFYADELNYIFDENGLTNVQGEFEFSLVERDMGRRARKFVKG